MRTHGDDSPVFDQPFWDNLYSERPTIWSGKPNPVLVDEASKLTPGRALDVGCGEGADAFWLADHGWVTTGADISEIALARARTAQADRTVEWLHTDLLDWTPPAEEFDLVSAQFFQLPPHQVGPAFRRFGSAVAPGGHLLVVGHSPTDPAAAQHEHADILFGAGAVTSLFDSSEWATVVAEDRPRANERRDTVVLLRRY